MPSLLKSRIFDIAFILVAAIIFLILNEFEQLEIVSQYPVIVVLIAYSIGKWVGSKKSKSV